MEQEICFLTVLGARDFLSHNSPKVKSYVRFFTKPSKFLHRDKYYLQICQGGHITREDEIDSSIIGIYLRFYKNVFEIMNRPPYHFIKEGIKERITPFLDSKFYTNMWEYIYWGGLCFKETSSGFVLDSLNKEFTLNVVGDKGFIKIHANPKYASIDPCCSSNNCDEKTITREQAELFLAGLSRSAYYKLLSDLGTHMCFKSLRTDTNMLGVGVFLGDNYGTASGSCLRSCIFDFIRDLS